MVNLPEFMRSVIGGVTAPEKPAQVELFLRAGALDGERPGWDAKRQWLFWVDIREPALHMVDPVTRDRRVVAQVEVADKSGGPDGACVDSEGFYNPLRLHSGLGYRSPTDCERTFQNDQASPMTSLPEQAH